MPRLKRAVPKYRLHKASGRALVTLHGQDHYLGPYESPESVAKYDELIAGYLAAGRRPVQPESEPDEITLLEVLAAYWTHAEGYYRKDGKPTSELDSMRNVMRDIKAEFSHLPVSQFGPNALKRVRQRWIDRGLTRVGVNKNQRRVTRIIRWAVAEELAPAAILQAVTAVPGLKKGRCECPEPPPVQPVDVAIVERTLPHLPPTVADMVRFQLLTGARPGEVCKLTPGAVDRSADVWRYRVAGHKTEHHGRGRIVFIGPEAQKVVAPYLLRSADAHCFCPREVVAKLIADRHANRITPLEAGNRPGKRSDKSDKPRTGKRRAPGKQYTTHSYGQAIARACDRAFPAPEGTEGEALKRWQADNRWSPNQLRHTAATDIRRRFGLEASQVILGHASAATSEIYAERDIEKAVSIARAIG